VIQYPLPRPYQEFRLREIRGIVRAIVSPTRSFPRKGGLICRALEHSTVTTGNAVSSRSDGFRSH
jgi:hypothetical protein